MTKTDLQTSRIVIVGAGNVGATFAYTLLLTGLAAEIVLIDKNIARAEGEAMDLNHSVPLTHSTHIWAGDYADCSGAAITIIAAGVNQKKGETRLDLVRNNASVFREIIPEVAHNNPNGIILVATNPVDVLTYATWKLSGLPTQRIIGSGTILDTARFRYLLSQQFGVDARSVHAFIVGEHGDSEVPVWSLANISGMGLQSFSDAHGLPWNRSIMDTIFEQTRDAAYHIIERKGATYYAVAIGLLRIVEAVLRDQKTVLSVSSLINDCYGINDVCLSLPAVVNRSGVERVLHLNFNPHETRGLQQSAQILKEMIEQLKL